MPKWTSNQRAARKRHRPIPDRSGKIRKRKPVQTNALAVVQPKPVIVQGSRARELKKEEIELLKRTVAKGTSDTEFAMFLWVARKHKLDPLTRQLHCVMRWLNKHHQDEKGIWVGGNQMTIQMGIDGYRSLAGRDHKDYGGSDEPEFVMSKEKTSTGAAIPEKATIRLWKKGLEHPVVGVAYWDEYAPKDLSASQAFMWSKMPRHMLAKCAEALAIRKGYPELSDIYTDEEMHQADQDFTESGRQMTMADGSRPSGLPPAEFHQGTKEEAQEVGRRRAAEVQQRMEKPLPASKKGIVTASIPSDASDVAYVSGDLSPEFIGYMKVSCSAFKLEDKDIYVVPIEMLAAVQQGSSKLGYAYQEVSGLPSPPATSKESAAAASKPESAVPPRTEEPGAPEPGHSGATAVSGYIKMVKGGVKSRNKGIEHYQVVIGEPDSGKGQMLYCYNKNLWPILEQAKGQTAELILDGNSRITGFKRVGKRMFDSDGITPEIQAGEERPKPGSLFK